MTATKAGNFMTGRAVNEPAVTIWPFVLKIAGHYDASKKGHQYRLGKSYGVSILQFIKYGEPNKKYEEATKLWKQCGTTFKKVCSEKELESDPYVLAAYCVFESYNSEQHRYNIEHKDGNAAGVGSTQSHQKNGKIIPGFKPVTRLSLDQKMASVELRGNAEYSIRFLAEEFHRIYYKVEKQDLERTIIRAAYGKWPGAWPVVVGDGKDQHCANYGTRAEYLSCLHVLYGLFKEVDQTSKK